jgi:hypothetical protein
VQCSFVRKDLRPCNIPIHIKFLLVVYVLSPKFLVYTRGYSAGLMLYCKSLAQCSPLILSLECSYLDSSGFLHQQTSYWHKHHMRGFYMIYFPMVDRYVGRSSHCCRRRTGCMRYRGHRLPPSPGQNASVKVNNTQPIALRKALLPRKHKVTTWICSIPFALLHRAHATQLTLPSSNHGRCAQSQVRSRNSGSTVPPTTQLHMGT